MDFMRNYLLAMNTVRLKPQMWRQQSMERQQLV